MAVTKQQQLEWLAKNHNFTNQHVKYVAMSASEIGLIIGSGTSCNAGLSINCHVITREEWQQERDKVQKREGDDVSTFHFVNDETLASNIEAMKALGATLVTPRKSDNSWHERGELPPVGCECEVLGAFGHYKEWFQCKIIAEHNGSVFAANERSWINVKRGERKFRPLRTEREKAIDELSKCVENAAFYCCGTISNSQIRIIAERLYDDGVKKVSS